MKEKLIQYKWQLAVIGIVILNIGWMIYNNKQVQEGVLIEEAPVEQTVVSDLPKELKENTASDSVVQEMMITTEEIELEASSQLEQSEALKASESLEKVSQVPVYICGEVINAGVYYVDQDAIINDVIACAGGLTRDADATVINLASPIQPNEKIIIPKQGEEIDKLEDSYENRERIETLPSSYSNLQSGNSNSSGYTSCSTSQTGLVNINTATKAELMGLSGIGEVKALAIIAYRQEQGGFKNIEEIMQISGIGEKTFEKLKPFITT